MLDIVLHLNEHIIFNSLFQQNSSIDCKNERICGQSMQSKVVESLLVAHHTSYPTHKSFFSGSHIC